MFPETSRIIPNPHGTAPGIDLTVAFPNSGSQHQCRLFALPGVPAEMVQMLSQTVEHRLVDELGVGNSRWFYHSIKLFGLGESDVEKVIPDLISRDRVPRVGITVSKATITLRIAAMAASEPEFHSAIQSTVEQIRSAFGDVIFGEGEVELNDVVQILLSEQKRTLSIIEVGAGSWIGQMLSDGFEPSQDSGLKHLSWLPNRPDSEDSKWLVKLALESKTTHHTDYALAVGIYPPLSEFTNESSLPTTLLHVVIVDPQGEAIEKTQRVSGHPELFYQRLAKTAIDLLRKELLSE
jgi:nicotinamide-nucleotide amidase